MGLIHIYLDDSGTRRPDAKPDLNRNDGVDHFALGGILIDEASIGVVIEAHQAFVSRWNLTGPLHSTKIRGCRGQFSWLGNQKEQAENFMEDLEALILGLPLIGIACVVDRPGYMARYTDVYGMPWHLCKTAYAILIERAAKFARERGSALEVYFEGAGKKEDRDILAYAKSLREHGMPFDNARSLHYEGLHPRDFQSIVVGAPNRVTKAVPMIQFADMFLYPMVKGGYDPSYAPYAKLMKAGLIIDALLEPEKCASLGVKYSCFGNKR